MKSLDELSQLDRATRIGEFAQFCRLTMLSQGRAADAMALGKGHTSQRVLDLLERAVVLPGGAGGAGSWGEQLTSPVLRAFVESLRHASAFAAAAAANLLVKVPIGDSVGLVMAGASDAVEAGAGDAIPVRKLDVANTTTPRRKCAAIVVLSNELLRAAPAAAESTITRELRGAVAAAVDSAFVTELTPGLVPHTSLGNALDDARMLLEDVNLTTMSRPFWISGTAAAIRLATQHTDGTRHAPDVGPTGGNLLDIPFYVSAGADPYELILVDGARVAGNLAEVEVSHAAQASVESDDAPAGGLSGSPAALTALGTTSLISLWQQDASGIKATQYFGVSVLRSGAVSAVTLAGSP